MDESIKEKTLRSQILSQNAFKASDYEFDESIEPFGGDPLSAKTVYDIAQCLEAGSADIDARVLVQNKNGTRTLQKMGKDAFLESLRKNESKALSFKESIDAFAYDLDQGTGGLVGEDYIPLLGGPFNKQLYYRDYLKMHATCFQAFHHDPLARQIVAIVRDFTLGRGFKINCDNKGAQALWDAFADVNNLDQLMEHIAVELSIYGEVMPWWLPHNQEYIAYQVGPNQVPPERFLPRVRLIDPSVIWEIVTYPEDISRVLYYQWVAPTQYQMYTGKDKGEYVPGSKFIYQQIPAEQVDHFKVNCVSNEKRGRSDLFPALGYMKRLRDSVNYSIIAMQKNAAWAIDTSIEGSQQDIDNYFAAQQALGTIPPAGSEFVHTNKIKREYLANTAGGGKGSQPSFDWCISMIAAATGIPVQYFGTHLSGGSTRASALVATEPVSKKFETRQLIYERILKKMASRLFKQFGIQSEIEVTFPEIVVQDRSQKLKDLMLAQSQGWISKERAAEISAKELGITEFNYQDEKKKIENEGAESPVLSNPLTMPGLFSTPKANTAITSQDRKQLDDNEGY